MKQKLLKLAIIPMLAMLLILTPVEASADVGLVGDLGVGGHVLLGGSAGNGNSGFAFGLSPYVSISPIDNLSIWGRLPFWEGYFDTVDTHVFPFVFGARYYFNILDNLRVYPGIGLGFSVLHTSFSVFGASFTNTSAGFSLEFHGGVEYEVIENLAIDANLNFFVPKIQSGAFVRIGVMAGVIYYIPVF